MKHKQPSNVNIFIEIGVLFLFFAILLTPIFVVIGNHSSTSDNSNSTDTSSTQERNYPKNTEQDTTPTESPTAPPPTPTEPELSPTDSTEQSQSTPPITEPTNLTCYHEEQGICWDELEDATYSAGLYDRGNGKYGATLDYPDPCDSVCRDIIDDAYEEGWYDGG